ncbi:hypothetical protein R84B8_02936 [Treponema sp. R8-4-B8]
MIAIDTEEKFNWLLEAFESDVFQFESKILTEEDRKEIRREIEEYKATHPKTPAKEAVLV